MVHGSALWRARSWAAAPRSMNPTRAVHAMPNKVARDLPPARAREAPDVGSCVVGWSPARAFAHVRSHGCERAGTRMTRLGSARCAGRASSLTLCRISSRAIREMRSTSSSPMRARRRVGGGSEPWRGRSLMRARPGAPELACEDRVLIPLLGTRVRLQITRASHGSARCCEGGLTFFVLISYAE